MVKISSLGAKEYELFSTKAFHRGVFSELKMWYLLSKFSKCQDDNCTWGSVTLPTTAVSRGGQYLGSLPTLLTRQAKIETRRTWGVRRSLPLPRRNFWSNMLQMLHPRSAKSTNFHVLFVPTLTSWGDEEDSSGYCLPCLTCHKLHDVLEQTLLTGGWTRVFFQHWSAAKGLYTCMGAEWQVSRQCLASHSPHGYCPPPSCLLPLSLAASFTEYRYNGPVGILFPRRSQGNPNTPND